MKQKKTEFRVNIINQKLFISTYLEEFYSKRKRKAKKDDIFLCKFHQSRLAHIYNLHN